MALVHGQQRLRQLWQPGGDFAQLGQGHSRRGLGHGRQRIAQLGQQPGFFVFRELLDIHPQHLVDLQQHGHRQRSLILFDLVQIARRQPQRLGQRSLRDAAFGAQAAQAYAHEGLGHGSCLPVLMLS